MKKDNNRYLLIPIIVLLLIIISTFFSFRRSGFVTFRWTDLSKFNIFRLFFKSSSTEKTTLSNSLINDENHVQNQINNFLKNNPNADETYARDVIYRDIARKEKNPAICAQIKDEYLKKSCQNAVV